MPQANNNYFFLSSLLHSFTFILINDRISINLAGRQTCTAGKMSNKFLKNSFSVTKFLGSNSGKGRTGSEHRNTGTDRSQKGKTRRAHRDDLTSAASIHPSLRRRAWELRSRLHKLQIVSDDAICAALTYVGFHYD